MNENTIDFLWRQSARSDAQAHWVDQVLMNINVNLMKVRKGRGGRLVRYKTEKKDELLKVKSVYVQQEF